MRHRAKLPELASLGNSSAGVYFSFIQVTILHESRGQDMALCPPEQVASPSAL